MKTGWFNLEAKLPKNAKPGMYYAVIFVKEGIRNIPYNPRKTVEADTEGSIPAIGRVFYIR